MSIAAGATWATFSHQYILEGVTNTLVAETKMHDFVDYHET